MASVIEIKDLVKDYKLGEVPVHVLRGISFEVERGDFVLTFPMGHWCSRRFNHRVDLRVRLVASVASARSNASDDYQFRPRPGRRVEQNNLLLAGALADFVEYRIPHQSSHGSKLECGRT